MPPQTNSPQGENAGKTNNLEDQFKSFGGNSSKTNECKGLTIQEEQKSKEFIHRSSNQTRNNDIAIRVTDSPKFDYDELVADSTTLEIQKKNQFLKKSNEESVGFVQSCGSVEFEDGYSKYESNRSNKNTVIIESNIDFQEVLEESMYERKIEEVKVEESVEKNQDMNVKMGKTKNLDDLERLAIERLEQINKERLERLEREKQQNLERSR